MPGGHRKPCVGGPYDAAEVARRVRTYWEAIPPKHRPGGKRLAQAMGLASESAWTKRTEPDKKGWVPFRVDELSMIKNVLAPDEPPGWPLLDHTALSLFRPVWNAVRGSAAPPGPDPAPSSGQPEGRAVRPRRKAR